MPQKLNAVELVSVLGKIKLCEFSHGAGILDEVIGCLVNKNGIHNVLSFRGWHSEWNGILQAQYSVLFSFLLAVLKIGFVHFIHDAVHILRGQLSAGK